ncbi:MAG TPA: LOG family protein [bacterium]|nr:LOG family protein [bacterium]
MGSGRVTVFGSSRLTEAEAEYEEARRLGRLLVQAGYTVCSGGYGGAMEAASRGAAEAGGSAIGITVTLWTERLKANPWLTREIPTPHLFERLQQLMESDAYVALPGGPGTLGEVALAWNLFQTESIPLRPLVLVGPKWRELIRSFEAGLRVEPRDLALLRFAETVEGVLPLLPGPPALRPR